MYLDPSLVPSADYVYPYESAGYTASFMNVDRIQVMPVLVAGGTDYYYTPTVDYTGDITGTNGSITFIRPGPYFVLATYTDDSQSLFDYGVGFQVHDGPATGPTHDWHPSPVPSADVYITDPALAKSQPTPPKGATVKNDLATWTDVLNYMKTLPMNAHVELSGHGAPGAFYYAGVKVLDSSDVNSLSPLVGKVTSLTFMSCLTSSGVEGPAFLQSVANLLGTSGGYTECVGGNGKEWFVDDSGRELIYTAKTPEPSTLIASALGIVFLVLARSRWAARPIQKGSAEVVH
jgi:hypothetical protein